jgi:hypothetical protein
MPAVLNSSTARGRSPTAKPTTGPVSKCALPGNWGRRPRRAFRREARRPELRLGVHRSQAKRVLVEICQRPALFGPRPSPAQARDLHPVSIDQAPTEQALSGVAHRPYADPRTATVARWTRAPVPSLLGAVGISAVGELDDSDRALLVVDAVDDAVGAPPCAVTVLERGVAPFCRPGGTIQ